ncbi:hypothetical protein Q0Z83_040180 [Actinoplanes sichuanensis]|uniref:Uncharacterized protein n=1 Tax=Actinoplanes sichuanensis TaxID=512349 RepID=A0ABW4A566_9ACTN|nr:hypothetical protein [Actinoplanes sichuanensis]BEL05827.1 hypothetical protein Q0Z83_040180 [Actinoplanes sichuanensis]
MPPADLLDTGDIAAVERYERHFYQAYTRLTDNRLVRRIWIFDDERQRVRTSIPYRDQVVYQWRPAPDAEPGCYLAVNLEVKRAFQSAHYGFTPEPGETCCEFLNVMTASPVPAGRLFAGFIRDVGMRDLVDRGFDVAYGTCTRRLLAPYLRLGAQHAAARTIDGEERHLLRWPIGELTARSGRG